MAFSTVSSASRLACVSENTPIRIEPKILAQFGRAARLDLDRDAPEWRSQLEEGGAGVQGSSAGHVVGLQPFALSACPAQRQPGRLERRRGAGPQLEGSRLAQ